MLTLAPEGVRMLRSRAGAAIWSYGSQWTLRPCLRANKTKPCGEGVCELVLQAAGQKGVRAQGLGHAWGARGAWLNPSTSTHEFALFSAGSKVHLSLLLLLFFFFFCLFLKLLCLLKVCLGSWSSPTFPPKHMYLCKQIHTVDLGGEPRLWPILLHYLLCYLLRARIFFSWNGTSWA